MTHNATPKPLSDEEQTGTKRVIRKALIGTGLVTTFDRLCAEIEINALKAQPAPVPLEFDSPLRQRLARLLYDLSDRISDDHEADYKRCELEWLSDADSVLRLLTPVPLAEDEALIEDLLELAESNDVYICDPEFKHRDMEIEDTLRAVAERLSLRSGQLARVLALKGGPSCNQCIRMVAHVDEIRAIVEGEK